MTEDDFDLDRERGFLTKKDREYLLGEFSYEGDQQERNRRRYIRERIRNALIDFSILKHLDERDREQIAKDIDPTKLARSDPKRSHAPLFSGIIDAVSFFYLLSDDAEMSFEKFVEFAILNVEVPRKGIDHVNIGIELIMADSMVEAASVKILKNEPLSEGERLALSDRLAEESPFDKPEDNHEKQQENGDE